MEKSIDQFILDVKDNISKILIHKNSEIEKLLKYNFSTKSKMLRPTFVFITAMNTEYSEVVSIASAMEILHVATLVHDDVVDFAKVRRGVSSINHEYGLKVAVVLGDYLFAKSFEVLSTLKKRDFTLPEKTIVNLALGEFEEIFYESEDITFKKYLKIINAKTSSMFLLNIGFMLNYEDVSKKSQINYFKFAKYFGMAFQIQDDCFDYFNEHSDKDLKIDESNNVVTLPKFVAKKTGYTLNKNNDQLKNECFKVVEKYFDKALYFVNKFESQQQKEAFIYTMNRIKKRKY